jgi:hypothetical protein
MTANQIIYSIKNRLEGFLPSDDSVLDPEYIADRISLARSELVRKLENQKVPIDDDFYQKVCCLEVKCEDTICGKYDIASHFYVDVPATIAISTGIKYFGTASLGNGFQYTSNSGFINNQFSQIASRGSYYTFVGGRAYVRNLPTPETTYLCMIAILDNPLADKCPGLSYDEEYPIPGMYVQEVEDMVVQMLLPSMAILADQVNDASNDQRANKLNYIVQPLKTRNRRR